MNKKSKLDLAAEQIEELINGDIAKRIKNANEATTRLLLINKILNILGWSDNDFNPEEPTITGFTDYILKINDQPKLIVEAKRYGSIKSLPKLVRNKSYNNSSLHKICGNEMKLVLDQCRRYCSNEGVRFAVATTGDMWIIMMGYRTGMNWKSLDSLVFHSLDDIYKRFAEFYGLLSKEAVKNNSLDETFGEMFPVKPEFAMKPRDQVSDIPNVKRIPNRRVINMFFDKFMDDITKDDTGDMLDHCYVDTRELSEFSKELRELFEYDSVLDEQGFAIDDVDEAVLDSELEDQFDFNTPKTVLLVGNVGSGKTTFIHRFVKYESAKIDKSRKNRKTICTVIDMINLATVRIDHDRQEEQNLSGTILKRLSGEFKDSYDPYDRSILRGCFREEIRWFRGQKQELLRLKPDEYALQEDDHLHELAKNKYDLLVGYIKNMKSQGYKIWIALDNIDRGSDSYQEFIYAFAHRLTADAGCVTIITLREDTYLEAKDSFLDVRGTDIIYRIKAPEIRQIIAKRRKYIEWYFQNKKLKGFEKYRGLLSILNEHMKHLILSGNDSIRTLITALSLSNIRYELELIKRYYTSEHSVFHELYYQGDGMIITKEIKFDMNMEYERFIQSLMLGNSWSYNDTDSDIMNLFAVDTVDRESHLLTLKMLAYLVVNKSKKMIKIETLINDFIPLGYSGKQIKNCIKRMLYSQSILSPNMPASFVKDDDDFLDKQLPNMKVTISGKGYFYLNHLSSNHYYQTRVGEDMIWYNEESIKQYISCLEESFLVQDDYGSQDALRATNAREVFLKYLQDQMREENQNLNLRSNSISWVAKVNEILEKNLFEKKLSPIRSVTVTASPNDEDEIGLPQEDSTIYHIKSNRTTEQTTMPIKELDDYSRLLEEASQALFIIPKNLKISKSTYLVRVLWALEVAFRAGIGSINASSIANILNRYGNFSVEPTNVAKFFRGQRNKKENTQLWSENPAGYFSISSVGQDMLNSIQSNISSDETEK
jgi:GTPase SAR1 family protein